MIEESNYGISTGIVMIPRAAVSIAFSTATIPQWLTWYNNGDICQNDFGPPCHKGVPYSFDEAMGR